MASTLREVLRAFESARGPLSLNDIARDLDITPGMLDGMIDYWVRKGKIRPAVSGPSCAACSSCASAKSCCTYAPNMPRSYVLVTDDAVEVGGCSCCSQPGSPENSF
jgi:hypothetical protein